MSPNCEPRHPSAAASGATRNSIQHIHTYIRICIDGTRSAVLSFYVMYHRCSANVPRFNDRCGASLVSWSGLRRVDRGFANGFTRRQVFLATPVTRLVWPSGACSFHPAPLHAEANALASWIDIGKKRYAPWRAAANLFFSRQRRIYPCNDKFAQPIETNRRQSGATILSRCKLVSLFSGGVRYRGRRSVQRRRPMG